MNEYMRNTDAFAFGMEEDARLRSTIVVVILLDRSPDWGVVVDRFDRVSRMMPNFRQRVVPSLPPAPPRWVHDHDFDLRYHLSRMRAAPPGDLAAVLEIARRAEMDEFDHARPMWHVTLVEELADGGAALVVKLHHSLADGIGGIQIARLVFDLEAEPRDLGPLPPVPDAPAEGPLDALWHTVAYDAAGMSRIATRAALAAPRLLADGVRRPRSTAAAVAATAASVYRTVRPIRVTSSPIMQQRRKLRELGVHEVSLVRLKEAAHLAGGSLNDAMLAGVTGGMRRYHELHGVEVDELKVTMPVSIRLPNDAAGGNRITLIRFSLPVLTADPVARIAEIRGRAESARHERSLPHTQIIAGGLNLVPRWYIGAILRHVDFLASNVPGIPVQVYIGGAAVQRQYAFGPTIGAGVNITMMSYRDICALGINVDSGAIPDFAAFRQCLVAGFDEVLALADREPPARRTPKTPAAASPRHPRNDHD